MNDFEARQLTLPEFFLHFFANLFQNPFAALANGSILAVVVFAMFIGIALVAGATATAISSLCCRNFSS